VFWSVKKQQILAESEFTDEPSLTESIVTKMPIIKFGKNAEQLKRLYPDAKMLVFTKDAWLLTGA